MTTKKEAMEAVIAAAKALVQSAGHRTGNDVNGDATYDRPADVFCLDGTTTESARSEILRALAELEATR